MYAGKRPANAAVSGKKKQAKQAGSAFGGAGNSAHDQHGAARFLTKPAAAAVVSGPLVLVFTFMALSAFWRQAPEISETAKRFVEVRQGVGGQPLSPPVLPTSVPSSRGKGLGVEGQDPKTHPPAGLKTLRLSSRHESRLKTQSPPATSFFGGKQFVDKEKLSLFAPFCPCIQGQDSKTQGLRVKTLRLTLAADSRL